MTSTLTAESQQLHSLGYTLTCLEGVIAFCYSEHKPTEKHPH